MLYLKSKLILLVFLFTTLSLFSAKKNPLKFTAKNIHKGKQEYSTKCISCHGLPGAKKNIAPDIPDLGSTISQEKKDEELFNTLSKGVNAMPSFQNLLTVEERWSLINYIRSFDPKMKGKIIGKLSFPKIDIQIILNEELKQVVYQINEIKNSKKIPLTNQGMNIFAKRMFGKIPIFEKPLKTNDKGILTVQIPEYLKGDDEGKIQIIAQLENTDKYGEVKSTVTGKLAQAVICKNILKKRTLWGKASTVPLWLLFSYLGIIILIFGGIIMIIFNLVKLRKLA